MPEAYLSDCSAPPITVGKLKELLAKLPDDMPVVGCDNNTGEDDDLTISTCGDIDYRDGVPTLEITVG